MTQSAAALRAYPAKGIPIHVSNMHIGKKRKVEFTYNSYGTDKQMHPRTDEKGVVVIDLFHFLMNDDPVY